MRITAGADVVGGRGRAGKYRAEEVTGGSTGSGGGGGGGGPPRSAGACYDFQKNQCSRGGSCRFSHDGGGGGGGGGGYGGRERQF